jgi:RNA polymerase sigma-70 factor (ECF subfamily)
MGPPENRGEDWFTATYAAHYPHIVRYGYRRLADAEASAELAQDVFVVAWRRRADVPSNSLPWLYGVARHLLANQWRARRSAPAVVPMPPDALPGRGASAEQDAAVDVAGVHFALATLSEPDQELLRLIGWEGLTLAEAATALGCSRPTAAVRLHRARRRLSAALAEPTPTLRPRTIAVQS